MADITAHRFLLRVPPELWERVEAVARRQGVSVNTLAVNALEGAVAFEREPQGITPRVPERVPEVAAVDVAGKRAQVDALLAASGGKVFRGPDFRGGKK